MAAHRFDAFAKALAGRSSRRGVLRRAGAGGLAAGALGAASFAPALAQSATPVASPGASHSCVVGFEATVRQGPSAGTKLTGRLALVFGNNGQIDNGLFLLDSGRTISVVGQTMGRAINLLFFAEQGQDIYGVGTLAQPLIQCAGAMGGPFVGPKPGDSGDWLTIPSTITVQIDADGCTSCVNGCRGCTGCSRPGIPCPECDGACHSTNTST